jgi:hypothetical protein
MTEKDQPKSSGRPRRGGQSGPKVQPGKGRNISALGNLINFGRRLTSVGGKLLPIS